MDLCLVLSVLFSIIANLCIYYMHSVLCLSVYSGIRYIYKMQIPGAFIPDAYNCRSDKRIFMVLTLSVT